MIKQRTLSNKIRATGVGLHTGKKINLTLNDKNKLQDKDPISGSPDFSCGKHRFYSAE